MSKKRPSKKTKLPEAKQIRHIHYFYIILAVIGLGTAIAAFSLPYQQNSVLGVQAGTASSNANAGKVDISITGENRSTFTEISIEAEPGDVTRFDDQSGDSNRGKGDKKEKRFRIKSDKLRENVGIENGKKDKVKRGKKNKDRRNRTASGEALLLPDQAVDTLIEKGMIQGNEEGEITGETATGTNGEPQYVIQGATRKKVFGLFPISLEKKITVSAANGEVEKTDMSWLDRILNTVSF